MTSSIMHSCDESDDSLRITSVEVKVEWKNKKEKKSQVSLYSNHMVLQFK